MISKISIKSIVLYQKHISPHKGYCCAYRYYTGEDSCSEYTKNMIIKLGFFKSIPYFFSRIKECKNVYLMNEHKTDTKKNEKVDICNEACGVLACL